MDPTRRTALAMGALAALPAWATEPILKPAARQLPDSPGWYRTRLGRFTITALSDGTLEMPVEQVFARPDAAELKARLARDHVASPMPLSVNAFVIDTGAHVVMIDTGTGTSRMFGSRLGQLQANLQASGYTPARIDEICITHMHTDHVGGLTVDGRAVFPNAIVRAEAREGGHYLSREKMAANPGDREDFESAMAMLEPYVKSGRFRPFDGETDLLPGVRARPAVGHTPGHTVYVVRSEGETLLLWGDLMHVAPVQFPLPAATVSFDYSQAESAANRALIFREAARDGHWIGAAHVGFPGIGKLRAEKEGGYSWLPIGMLRGR